MSRAAPTQRGWRWTWPDLAYALAWSAALAALTAVPYAVAAARAPAGFRYLGFVFNPDEPNVHLSWIRQAAEGAWFFRNEFTSEPHLGRFFNLFMLAVGRAAGALDLSAYQAWAISRLLAVMALGVVCSVALGGLGHGRAWRRYGLAVLTLSSGLGWLWVGVDETQPLYGWLSALSLLGVLLLLIGAGWCERAMRDGDALCAGGAVLVALLLHAVPRGEPVLLVGVGLCTWLVASIDANRWEPRRLLLPALLLLAARPNLTFGNVAAWAMIGAGLTGYTVIRLARRPRLEWTRWLVLLFAVAMVWFLAGPRAGLDPVDTEPNLVMPEAITFLTAYLNPLFAASMALLLVALIAGERALREGNRRQAVIGGVAGLLLANMHTYDAVPLLATLGVYAVVLGLRERHRVASLAAGYGVLLALIVPAVAYQSWLIASEPLYRAKAFTPTLTPPLETMLVSFGLLVPLALTGGMALLRRRPETGRFLVVWLVVHALCIYLPAGLFPFQRKMCEGFHLVLALLATVGLVQISRQAGTAIAWLATWPRLRGVGPVFAVRADLVCRRAAWSTPVALFGLVLLAPSNILFVASTLEATANNNQQKVYAALMPPFAIPDGEWTALLWMHDNLPKEAVVACLPMVGNYLPGRAARTAFLGHWAETIGFGDKVRAFSQFLKEPGTAQQKVAFLHDHRITHLYLGYYEQKFTAGQWPQLPELQLVYPEGELEGPTPVLIYQVLAKGEPPKPRAEP